MKTLYFIGNEELWKDAWFLALVESLKKNPSLNVVLFDAAKDFNQIQTLANKITNSDRVVEKKDLGIKLIFPENLQSLHFKLSKEKVVVASQREIAWGAKAEDFINEVGIGGQSNIAEEAFLFDINLASEISKAIEIDSNSQLDANALSADAAEFEKFLDVAIPASPSTESKEEEPKNFDPSLTGPSQLVIHNFGNQKMPLTEDTPPPEMKAPEATSPAIAVDITAGDTRKDEKILQALEGVVDLEIENSDGLKPLADDASKAIEVKPVEAVKVEVEVSHLIASISQEVSGEDLDVIKRYSNIKERELREAQATTEALRRQIRYFDERLKKSEEERRKLLLQLEEVQNNLRTASDKKDENRAQIKNIESHYEEKIKELQIQLESSQFQAGKLDKKLEDFRERVRSDLQKIRSRERELASRLEIQKRDAEALLSAKDERLLNQKRDIDRLEFDLDSLRERLMDDAQKSEERRKRIARALQSLKLAQSVLSGLDEDTTQGDEKSKAA